MYNDYYYQRENDSENYLQNQSEISIDPDDLYIIKEPSQWEPEDEIVFAYAKKSGFDILNDPPELIDIAKKYLKKPLPKNILRSFKKENLDILYINKINWEIYPDLEIDDECRAEYEMTKKNLKEKKKKKKKGKKRKKK